MSELYYQDKENRPGNSYPVITDNRATPDRESMLYSYANTVEECYAGDFRIYAKKFGDYLRDSKSKVFDLAKEEFIDIPIRYASPQQAFSDNLPNNSTGLASEASLTNRVVLPLVSYYILDSKRDEKRSVNPCVRYRVKPKNKNFDKAFVTHAPIPIDYQIQVDIWTEFREHLFQLLTAFHNDFNPMSYLTDVYDMTDETNKLFYTPYVPMVLDSIADTSNFIPGTDRRVVRGTVRITIKGWMTPPLHEESYVHRTTSIFNVAEQSEVARENNISAPGVILAEEYKDIDKVASVFGRDGDVSAQSGDYTAAQIPVTTPGNTNLGSNVQEVLTNLVSHGISYSVILGEPLPALTCFKLVNGKAFAVKSLSSISPVIDGIILEAGILGASVKMGIPGTSYHAVSIFDRTAPLFLSQTGTLTLTRPLFENGDKYLLVVGHSNENSDLFMFNPSMPVKLS